MNDNFDEKMIQTIKEKATKRKRPFVYVPPGNASRCNKIPSSLYIDTYPSIVFQQTITGKNCLMLSFLNALHSAGYTSAANDLFQFNSTMIQELNVLQEFRDAIKNKWKTSILKEFDRVGFQEFFGKVKKSQDYWTVVLASSDGDIMHAVTVWHEMIFDSSFEKALPLSIEALDFCVGEGCRCHGIRKGYQINLAIHGENLRKHHLKLKQKRESKKIDSNKKVDIEHAPKTSKKLPDSKYSEETGIL